MFPKNTNTFAVIRFYYGITTYMSTLCFIIGFTVFSVLTMLIETRHEFFVTNFFDNREISSVEISSEIK